LALDSNERFTPCGCDAALYVKQVTLPVPALSYVHVRRFRTMEASMHGSFDRPGKSENRVQRSWSIEFFALPLLFAIALIGLVIAQPAASSWISEAVQAEFAGADLTPVTPVQMAKPDMRMSTIGTY
jgi:hypothetical protein